MMLLCVSLFACTPPEGTPSESSSEPQSSPESTPIETPKEESTPEPSAPEATEPETEPETEPLKDPITLNIGSYNIANGSAVNHDMSKLAEDIVDKKLDIVGFQEVDQKVLRSKRRDTMKLISEASGLQYYAFFKAIDLQGGEYGVAVLSKYPIVETHRTELYSGTEEQRVLGHAVIDVDGVLINFFVTHLSFESKELRNAQFATIAEKTAGLDNFIITGDFNTSNFAEYAPIKNSDMVNSAKHSINTFSNPNPTSSIDNIVFSKDNWTFGKPAVLPNGKSDHCMLYAQGTFDPN
jgi:endonuclease/exonuclease/phosphatase family metal-dependent hydrolase